MDFKTLNQTITSDSRTLREIRIGEAGRLLYVSIWDDFCDWYIEMSKETLAGRRSREINNT